VISEPCKKRPAMAQRAVQKRPAMAKRVVKAQIDKRVGSRHRLYPCCGKRRAYCKCDWGWYRRNIKAKEQNKFWGIISNAELLRGTDTADMGYFLEEVACPLLVDAPLAMFLKACLVFRRFSRVDTWKIIQEEILKPKTDWVKVNKALRKRVEHNEPLFGGTCYPTVLRAYRTGGSGPWIRVKKGADMVEREVKTLQLLCASIPHKACAAYDERAGRETFREFYSQCDLQFRATTSGVWGDYAFKCVLDGLTLGGKVPDHHLCVWPEGCPAYKTAIAQLFVRKPARTYEALCFLYYESATRHGGRLRFAEVLMHLCWNKRRAAGVLDDSVCNSRTRG
jgi:hypothetical protein